MRTVPTVSAMADSVSVPYYICEDRGQRGVSERARVSAFLDSTHLHHGRSEQLGFTSLFRLGRELVVQDDEISLARVVG